MARGILSRNEIGELSVHGVRETIFFSEVDGRLCQWVELDLSWQGWRADLEVSIAARGSRREKHVAVFGGGEITVRCPAPVLWPGKATDGARLRIRHGKRIAEGAIRVGTHRPWTIYLISDLCADDTWAYGDLAAHDRDDYLTTLAELEAGPENRYNLATVYQADRFRRWATPREQGMLSEALRTGRVYMTPVPNQLLPGAFDLASYPLLLDPYRRQWQTVGKLPAAGTADAYHMEAPTWTPGLANLLACAGFRSFSKSMLQYAAHAPWVDTLRGMPRLTRLEAAPGRFVYLLLRCGDYSEGMPILAGLPHANAFLHERAIPEHEALGAAYPTSAIPLVGMYSDLFAGAREWTRVKVAAVRDYNAQWWDYPKLVNATWTDYFDHAIGEVGPPAEPKRRGLRTVRGGTGASWEAWMLRAQREAARFRAAQRDVVSLRTACALLGRRDAQTLRDLDAATAELVNLGDHAWNGSSDASKVLNLRIRRERLDRLERAVSDVRERLTHGIAAEAGRRIAVVNTLGWTRDCRVQVAGADGLALSDDGTGDTFAIHNGGAVVPHVEGLGSRVLTFVEADGVQAPPLAPDPEPALPPAAMKPYLLADGRQVRPRGSWRRGSRGHWEVGPFSVAAALEGAELRLDVKGRPPPGSYSLCWRFDLPWKRCRWRAESGGGFMTPGRNDDSLLGICGSNLNVGGGLSTAPPGGKYCIDFAFDQSGLCGLGGPTTELAARDPHGMLRDSYLPDSTMRNGTTAGALFWYLLTTEPLPNESLPDQGGDRQWSFRCALRRRPAGFDNVDLYRFAAEFLRPAELICPASACGPGGPGLTTANDAVLVLGAAPREDGLAVDLYNTSRTAQDVRIGGHLLQGRTLSAGDMLERETEPCPGGKLRVGPLAYVRLVLA